MVVIKFGHLEWVCWVYWREVYYVEKWKKWKWRIISVAKKKQLSTFINVALLGWWCWSRLSWWSRWSWPSSSQHWWLVPEASDRGHDWYHDDGDQDGQGGQEGQEGDGDQDNDDQDDHNIGGWWPWWVMEAVAGRLSPPPASQPTNRPGVVSDHCLYLYCVFCICVFAFVYLYLAGFHHHTIQSTNKRSRACVWSPAIWIFHIFLGNFVDFFLPLRLQSLSGIFEDV